MRQNSPRPQLALLAVALIGALCLGACAEAWRTPVAPTPTPTATLAPVLAPTRTPTPMPTLAPTPTPALVALTFTAANSQFWTDPNDISGLLCAGQQVWAVTSGGVVRWSPATGEHQLYTTRDGLASQAVLGIAEDGDGHIWVGYAQVDALSEFDGRAWSTYASRREAVEARSGAMRNARQRDPRLWSYSAASDWLWLTTADGQAQAWDGAIWRRYGAAQNVMRNTWLTLVADEPVATGEDEETAVRVWAVGQGFSTVLEGYRVWEDHDLFSGIPAGGRVTDAALDASGQLWLSYAGANRFKGGLVSFDQPAGRWTGYDYTLVRALPRHIHDLSYDADGRLWAYGDPGIAVRGADGYWQRVADFSAQCGARDADGRLWVGTAHGLYALDDAGQPVSGPWLIPSPLLGNDVTSLVQDAEGRLWVGTTRGLSFIAPDGRTGIALDVGVTCTAQAGDGGLWVGTQQGLYQVEGERAEQRRAESIAALTFDVRGELWACTSGGVIYRGADWQRVTNATELTQAPVTSLAVGSAGTVWLASENGLAELLPDGTSLLHTEKNELLSRDVRALRMAPDDTLWIATGGGLARHLANGRWTRFTVESTEGGLRSKDLRELYVDGAGNLWIATVAGLSFRTPDTDWSYYDLPTAQCVLPVDDGVFWVGTRGGLYRLRSELFTAIE
ncbi:MAG: hypothetical protein GX557_06310 [Chloroflexi bacterium]|nr:hypothetical protein [Chloroflexota bacterium]